MTFKECFMTTGHQKQDNDLEKKLILRGGISKWWGGKRQNFGQRGGVPPLTPPPWETLLCNLPYLIKSCQNGRLYLRITDVWKGWGVPFPLRVKKSTFVFLPFFNFLRFWLIHAFLLIRNSKEPLAQQVSSFLAGCTIQRMLECVHPLSN